MGLETRIGVVTGLVIVVIASVYFFYGARRADDEIFLTTSPKITATPGTVSPTGTPKIPISTEGKLASADNKRSPSMNPYLINRGTPSTPTNNSAAPRPVAPYTFTPQKTTFPAVATNSNPKSVTPMIKPIVAPSKPLVIPPSPRTPIRTVMNSSPQSSSPLLPPSKPQTQLANATPPRGSPPSSKATPLRTGASDELTEATWDNLTKSGARPPKPSMSEDDSAVRSRVDNPSPAVKTSNPGVRDTSMTPAKPPATAKSNGPTAGTRHTVARGDTLAGLSKQYYGTTGKVAQIVAANPGLKRSSRLRVGQTIEIPTARSTATESLPGANPSQPPNEKVATASAAKTYQVHDGETFYSIAQKTLGDGNRWQEVYKLNKSVVKNDPRHLSPGMTLRLPQ